MKKAVYVFLVIALSLGICGCSSSSAYYWNTEYESNGCTYYFSRDDGVPDTSSFTLVCRDAEALVSEIYSDENLPEAICEKYKAAITGCPSPETGTLDGNSTELYRSEGEDGYVLVVFYPDCLKATLYVNGTDTIADLSGRHIKDK